jgi:hypothetical protein
MRDLAARGYACRFLDVLCSPSELAAAPLETKILELVLQHARRVSFKSRAYYAVELPAGGCVSFRLEDSGFSGPIKTRFENLEDIRGEVSNSIRDLLRSFRERKELNSNYRDRASGRVLDGGVQIGRSGSATPGIVVLCLGDSDWSVRECIAAARAELDRKKAAGRPLPVGVVFASFFHPEVERQKARAPDWAAKDIETAERQMPFACVQAAWVDLAGTASLLRLIKPLSGDDLPMAILLPDLVPFPSSVDERALAGMPPSDSPETHRKNPE